MAAPQLFLRRADLADATAVARLVDGTSTQLFNTTNIVSVL